MDLTNFKALASAKWALYKTYLLAGLVIAALIYHFVTVGAIKAEAMNAGRAEVQAEWTKEKLERSRAENRSLLIQADRIATLQIELEAANAKHQSSSAATAAARARAAESDRRLRDATTDGVLENRVANSSCNVVRGVAAGAIRTAQTCRSDVAEIGLGIGGLVESTESAHYEHERANALMRFSMPKPPFKPDQEN